MRASHIMYDDRIYLLKWLSVLLEDLTSKIAKNPKLN